VVAPRKYPDELRERAVRLYREADPKPVIRRLAEQLNVHPEALRNWIRQDQADRGERVDQPTTEMIEENRRLKREVAELRRLMSCGHSYATTSYINLGGQPQAQPEHTNRITRLDKVIEKQVKRCSSII
jgi:transposase